VINKHSGKRLMLNGSVAVRYVTVSGVVNSNHVTGLLMEEYYERQFAEQEKAFNSR
jgi:hypothetical protein